MNSIDPKPANVAIDPHVSRSIDIIRGAAALGVIWGHSMYGLKRMELDVYLASIPIELNGGVWVWIFLPISGYLVGHGFRSGGYELSASGYCRFLFNRALRILPLAYVALVIGLVARILSGEKAPENSIAQLLFVSSNNDMSLVNGFWTIAVELHFYLAAAILAPLVAGVYRTGGLLASALLFLGAVYFAAYWIEHVGDNANQPRTFLGNLAFFVFGLVLAQAGEFRLYFARQCKFIVIFGLIVLVWWLQNFKPSYFWGWGANKGPLGGTMVIAMVIVAASLLIRPGRSSRSRFLSKAFIALPITWLQW